MNTVSILPEQLKSFDYYKDKLPMYLQNSYGFIEHYRIWYDMLMGKPGTINGIVPSVDMLLYMLDIFDSSYFGELGKLGDLNTQYMLDNIGALFGVKRNMSIAYHYEGKLVPETLALSNEEFIQLIKARVIRNYCEGTYEQINQYYKSAGLEIVNTTNRGGDTATSGLYLIKHSNQGTLTNLEKLFLAEELHIASMGIQYFLESITIEEDFLWDTIDHNWDQRRWC